MEQNTAHKMQETADLITFTEEILNGKLHFLWSEKNVMKIHDVAKISLAIWETFLDENDCNYRS